jgi:hypothetical protein
MTRMLLAASLLTSIVLVLSVANCGGGYGIGAGCHTTDQCESGLECLPFCGVKDDGRVCTVPCSSDTACGELHEGATCWSCPGGNVCFPD